MSILWNKVYIFCEIFGSPKIFSQDPPLLSGSTPKCIGDMTCMIKDELGFVPVSTMVDLVINGQSYVFTYNTDS